MRKSGRRWNGASSAREGVHRERDGELEGVPKMSRNFCGGDGGDYLI